MSQDPKSKSSNVRKLCSTCMGMVRFTRNKNDWTIDVCDYCMQNTKVKIEARNESVETNTSLKPVPYPLPQLQEVEHGKFWKTWKGIAIICSIAFLAYILFV